MAMTRKAKILLIVLAIPLVLLVAAVITLKVMFTSEKLKAMLIPRIEAATHRNVAINDISLTVLPSLGVDMDGFTMSNRPGEGFSQTPFMTLERLHVSLKLMPLLQSRVEVDALTLDRPRLLVETNSRGETNYADMTGGADSAGAAGRGREQETSPGGVFLVKDLRVNDGVLDYVDHKDNSAARVRGLDVAMGVDGQSERLVVAGTASIDSLSYGTVEAAMLSGLRLDLDHRMVYDMASDVLTFEKGDLTLQDMKMTVAGTVSGVRKDAKVLNVTIGSDKLNIADLFSLIPAEYMKKAEGLKGSGTAQVHIALTGTMTDSTTADVSGTISTSGASLQYPKLPRPISNISIASDFTRSKAKQEFRVEKLTANLGDNPVTMAMTVVNFENPSLTLTANGALNLAEVGQFYPLEQGTELGGRMTADVRVAGKVKDPASLKSSGTMRFEGVTARTATSKNPVQNLNGSITFNNQLVESKNLAMTVGRSDLRLGFWLKNYLSLMSTDKAAPKPVANVTLQSNHLYTADIMGEEGKPQEKGSAGGGATAGRPDQAPEAGAPPARQQKSAMPLPNVDMDVNASIATLTMQKFEFNNVRATMKVSNGIITMQNFTLNAYGGTVSSKGTLNLQNPARPLFDLALDLKSMEANALLSEFTSFGQRINGDLTMSTAMKGALNDTLGLVPSTLDGNGKVDIRDGALKGFKVNQALASSLKLPDLEVINFKDWTNAFAVQNGRVVIKDLKISALNADYVVNGSQGIDGTLAYAMTLYLPENLSSRVSLAGFAGEAVNLFKDQSGRLKLDFAVGGTTDDPKVQLDAGAARQRAEEMAKQKVAQETKKVQEQVKEKAGNVLRDLLKGKKK